MRYNPCGAPIEIGRRPYTCKIKPYPDSDILVDWVWFEARHDVPFLRGPNALNSLQWVADRCDEFNALSVGEDPNTPRVYTNVRINPLAIGGHVCGTKADFAGNGHYQPDPPVEYRPDGLPFCCGQFFMGQGGLKLGGVAEVISGGSVVGSGGLKLDGTADVVLGVVGAGGLKLDGAADVILGAVGTGGLVLGGVADAVLGFVGTGGLLFGGSATAFGTLAPTLTASSVDPDGVTLRLTFSTAVNYNTGLFTIGGTQVTTASYSTGTGTTVIVCTLLATIFIGSAVVVSFSSDTVESSDHNIPNQAVTSFSVTNNSTQTSGPTPGDTCETAGGMSLGSTVTLTLTGTGHKWLKAPVVADGTYHWTVSTTSSTLTTKCYIGHTCATLGLFGTINGSGCIDGVSATDGFMFMEIIPFDSTPVTATFGMGEGTCP